MLVVCLFYQPSSLIYTKPLLEMCTKGFEVPWKHLTCHKVFKTENLSRNDHRLNHCGAISTSDNILKAMVIVDALIIGRKCSSEGRVSRHCQGFLLDPPCYISSNTSKSVYMLHFSLYADDTQLYVTETSETQLIFRCILDTWTQKTFLQPGWNWNMS